MRQSRAKAEIKETKESTEKKLAEIKTEYVKECPGIATKHKVKAIAQTK